MLWGALRGPWSSLENPSPGLPLHAQGTRGHCHLLFGWLECGCDTQAGQGCLCCPQAHGGAGSPQRYQCLGPRCPTNPRLLLELAGCHRQDNGRSRATRLSPSRRARCGGVTLPHNPTTSPGAAPAEGRERPGSSISDTAPGTQGLWLLLQEKNTCEAFGSVIGCSSI